MDIASLEIGTVVSMPFGENTYVVSRAGRDDCVVVDPGLEPDKIEAYLSERSLTPVALLCTHGHSDHIGGNSESRLKARWSDCPIVVGSGDATKLTDPKLNLSAAFGIPITSPAADVLLAESASYEAAGWKFSVRSTPGHSAGHVVFVLEGVAPTHVFCGDVIFQGSVGRTDFPDGDMGQLVASIHEKLFSLPDDTVLLPGHGDRTTVGAERRGNPFVGAPAGYSPDAS